MKNLIKNTKNSREKGNIGEDIACFYLKKHDFLIQERNYLRKWGEIDIIAVKDGILHFIEVKSVVDKGNYGDKSNSNGHRPEENVHNLKVRRLKRTIQTYLNERKYDIDAEFRFHIITVIFNERTGKFYVKMLENIIL
jgi:putative endonuclease